MSIQEYRQFIASKARAVQMRGFEPGRMNAHMKAHQNAAVDFALRRGSAALFLDTGLGKSLCELEWARQVSEHTGRPVLILTPLAVAAQMVREGVKFGIEAHQVRDASEVKPGVNVANYERLPKLDARVFGGVVLDESSILKSFAGRTRNMLMDAFKDCPFKLAATATPSPNDHMELGNHAEFLGVMRQQEMLSKWATHDAPVTVWCETNDESALLAKMIPGAREVRGDMKPEEKEARLLGFADGDFRVMVTKPKLAGFGLNWQHCAHAVFASISFSYEQHYQAVRRSYRFGQTGQVRNDIVIADTEAAIWQTIHGKAEKHAEMKRRMADAMTRAQRDAQTRVKYDRPLDLAFPEWIKGETA